MASSKIYSIIKKGGKLIPKFDSLLKIIYDNIYSKLLNNNHYT